MKAKNPYLKWLMSIAVLLALPMGAVTAVNNNIILTLEEPTDGSTYSGVANIRGWAVAPVGIDHIELLIDGSPNTNIPSGGRRVDVGNAFPNFPNSNQSGFSMAFNYSNLSAGSHTILVRAVDTRGDNKDASATFNVTRFDNPFVPNPASVNPNTFGISDLTVEGKHYQVELEWRTAAQGFAITQITPTSGTGAGTAQWTVVSRLCCTASSLTFSVTLDGTTKSSQVTASGSGSCPNSSVEGFTTTTAGPKNYVASASGGCLSFNNMQGTANFADGSCYEFVVALNDSNQPTITAQTVNCASLTITR